MTILEIHWKFIEIRFLWNIKRLANEALSFMKPITTHNIQDNHIIFEHISIFSKHNFHTLIKISLKIVNFRAFW